MTTKPAAFHSFPRPQLFVQDKVFIPGTSDVAISITLAWNDGTTEDPNTPTTAAKVYIGDKALAAHGMTRAIAAAVESILPAYIEWIEAELDKEDEDDETHPEAGTD